MTGLWIAMLLAAPCPCVQARIDWREIDRAVEEAARRADDEFRTRHYEAMQRMHDELEAIAKANREAFERGER